MFLFCFISMPVLLEDSTEYGSSFRLWANSESKLTDTLNGIAESIDKSCNNLKSIVSTKFVLVFQNFIVIIQ